ncbi:MAG: hypothetical protein LH472_10060 [Pyrinomonadaceae bacterium]|nr:hypothetical protein [Pyrinomonadaceae bacterium]
MLMTIEAEIDVNGRVTFLEPLNIRKKSRAIVTLLDDVRPSETETANGDETEATHPLELLGRLPKINAPPDFSERHDFYAHGKLED